MRLRTSVVLSVFACLLFACGDDGGGASDAMVVEGADAQVVVIDAQPSDAAIPLPSGPRFIYRVDSETAVSQELFIGAIDGGAAVTPQPLHPPLGTNQIADYFVISNDGQWVLYEVRTTDGTLPDFWRGGGGSILDYSLYLVDISRAAPGAPTLIRGPVANSFGFGFTGDSKHIVLTHDDAVTDSRELYSRDISSGTPAAEVKLSGTLVAGGRVASWRASPADGRILYTAYQTSATTEDVYVVDANAPAVPVKVNGTMPDGGEVRDFEWSPDATKLLYVADQGTLGRREGWLATFTGTTPATAQRFNQALTTSDDVWSAQFTADSNNILYRADHDTPGEGGVYRVDVSSGIAAAQRVSPAGARAGIEDVTADSQWIAMQGGGNLWIADLTSPTGAPPVVTVAGQFAKTGLRISGDGAIISHRVNFGSGQPFELYATTPGNPTGSTKISAATGYGLGIVYTQWAPTGRRLAYDFENAAGGRELYLIEFTATTAGTPTLISDATASTHTAADPTWAADGLSLTYIWQTPTGGYDVYWVDLSGATPGTPTRINEPRSAGEDITLYRRVP